MQAAVCNPLIPTALERRAAGVHLCSHRPHTNGVLPLLTRTGLGAEQLCTHFARTGENVDRQSREGTHISGSALGAKKKHLARAARADL
jgi:hypothetical protein